MQCLVLALAGFLCFVFLLLHYLLCSFLPFLPLFFFLAIPSGQIFAEACSCCSDPTHSVSISFLAFPFLQIFAEANSLPVRSPFPFVSSFSSFRCFLRFLLLQVRFLLKLLPAPVRLRAAKGQTWGVSSKVFSASP